MFGSLTMYVNKTSNVDKVIDDVRDTIKDRCGDDTYVKSVRDKDLVKVNYLGPPYDIQQAIKDPEQSNKRKRNMLALVLGAAIGLLALLLACLGKYFYSSKKRRTHVHNSKSPLNVDGMADLKDVSGGKGNRIAKDGFSNHYQDDYNSGNFDNDDDSVREVVYADSFLSPDLNHPGEIHSTQNVHTCVSSYCTECQNRSQPRFIPVLGRRR